MAELMAAVAMKAAERHERKEWYMEYASSCVHQLAAA
jgi:hypothetical protein